MFRFFSQNILQGKILNVEEEQRLWYNVGSAFYGQDYMR